ncbi:MAG: ribonuclease HII [Clostridiales bacterium]|jgi:ribonuclease HII|nr:ribonuclease HII [Clostridiales bacterium]
MKIKDREQEQARLDKLLNYENEYYARGAALIAGADEVGRGPLAGPVLACAVILPRGRRIENIDDSKRLTEKRREILDKIIRESALAVSIGIAHVKTIDEINILQATVKAMTDAVNGLSVRPDVVLIDALRLPGVNIPQRSIIKGDALSMSVAAASIVAKVARDAMMRKYHELYPEYGFDQHKGYGTKKHITAICEFGLCPIHRRSFSAKFTERAYE